MIGTGKVLLAEQDGVSVLKLVGDVRLSLGPTIASFVDCIGKTGAIHSIVIDLAETDGIDSTALGLLAKVSFRSQDRMNSVPTIVSPNEDITRILQSMGFENIFVIVSEAHGEIGPLGELPTQLVSEESLRNQVLEAHHVLMSLSEENAAAFRDLVSALENEACARPVAQIRAVR